MRSHERYYFRSDRPFLASVWIHASGKCDITIWEVPKVCRLHPDDVPDKTVRHGEAGVSQERAGTLLKNFSEFDPEIVDHLNPHSYFRLDIGGEG